MPLEFQLVNDSDPDSDTEDQEAVNAANALYESHSAYILELKGPYEESKSQEHTIVERSEDQHELFSIIGRLFAD